MKINRIILSIFAIFSLLAVSCDKIAEEDYLIFSGAAGEWYDGNGVADQSQRVFLEKYTGQHCSNCPDADQDIHDAQTRYGNQLIAVSVHDNSAFCTPIPYNGDTIILRTEDGCTWSETLGMLSTGKPSILLNRTMSNGNYTPTKNMYSDIDNILALPATVAIAAAADMTEENVKISMDVEFLQSTTEPLTLTLLLMEDGIIAPQKQPDGSIVNEYVHNHVLRDVITDVWGMTIDADGNAGTKRYCEINYNGMSSDWNLANCHIVAFVSKKDTREILNAAKCSIEF